MPSTPQNDSPFASSLLQREMGRREPGTPSTAGKPGVQTGRLSFPAPPGPATAPVGKPPAQPGPQPLGGQVIDRGQGLRGQVIDRLGGQVIDRFGGQVIDRATGGAPAPTPGPVPAIPPPYVPPPPAGAPTAQPVVALPRAPLPDELVPGITLQTPHGTVESDVNGQQQLTLSPEGRQRYAEVVARTRESLGPMPLVFKDIKGLPELPVEPGRWNYNPFTGRFAQ